jgi:hypothetical protein
MSPEQREAMAKGYVMDFRASENKGKISTPEDKAKQAARSKANVFKSHRIKDVMKYAFGDPDAEVAEATTLEQIRKKLTPKEREVLAAALFPGRAAGGVTDVCGTSFAASSRSPFA